MLTFFLELLESSVSAFPYHPGRHLCSSYTPLVSNSVPHLQTILAPHRISSEVFIARKPHAFGVALRPPVVSPCATADILAIACSTSRLSACIIRQKFLSITYLNISQHIPRRPRAISRVRPAKGPTSSIFKIEKGKELGHNSTKHRRDLGQSHTLLDLAYHPTPTSRHPRPRVHRALPLLASGEKVLNWTSSSSQRLTDTCRPSCRTPHPASLSSPTIQ
ncbi:hypothetical protein QBC36DRAFT_94885 [Triangularia setosa]|uniref:Uncharacterized protein n=1 Tax=Triangularia setosa TaxID=2587417 RepID=A0AAN7A2Y7_9PEZI|nr:hypothetical protein QBC36DRAFT_94885 [Podospora setosa]